jgi:hypothetical protein
MLLKRKKCFLRTKNMSFLKAVNKINKRVHLLVAGWGDMIVT